MKRFRFKADLLVNAANAEALLAAIGGHLGDMSRHLGNAADLSKVCEHFTVEEVPVDWAAEDAARAAALANGKDYDNGTNDLVDHVAESSGPIELNLDPKSAAGIAYAEQQVREKSEREAQKVAQANAGKTDAEIMAEVKAREEAADPGHPSYQPPAA